MTSEELEELERMEREATPGPWEVRETGFDNSGHPETVIVERKSGKTTAPCVCLDYEHYPGMREANAALITALRNAAPSLIAAARERDQLLKDESGWRDECQAVRSQNVRLKAGRLDDLRQQINSDIAYDAERFNDKSTEELADILLTATAGVPTAYFSLFNAIRDRLATLTAERDEAVNSEEQELALIESQAAELAEWKRIEGVLDQQIRDLTTDLQTARAENQRLRAERDKAVKLLARIRDWDHMDSAGDGFYWRGEIDSVLARARQIAEGASP